MTDAHPAPPTEPPSALGIQDILNTLPHRFPFVLVDRVLSRGDGVAHALKNVSIGEPFFAGHFPAEPVMPGVLIVEALAQTSMFCLPLAAGTVAYLAGVDAARFKRKVVPGDQLHLHARLDMPAGGWARPSAAPRWTDRWWPRPRSCSPCRLPPAPPRRRPLPSQPLPSRGTPSSADASDPLRHP